MPIRARSFGRLVLGSPTEMPSTVIAPCVNGSSPLTHLINVDLPEPDGPHTTTTSPLATFVEQRLRTWKGPYHLLTSLMSIWIDRKSTRLNSSHANISYDVFCLKKKKRLPGLRPRQVTESNTPAAQVRRRRHPVQR